MFYGSNTTTLLTGHSGSTLRMWRRYPLERYGFINFTRNAETSWLRRNG